MKKIFKPRARMLLQLGDQLIKNENIAIVELVKNSYDAGSTVCKLDLQNIDDKESAVITITDNGIGMTPKVVTDVWLEPGADFKELILNNQLDLFEYGYQDIKRKPIGEKGIGRFGVHKLGDHILLVTKNKYSAKEVVIQIDWENFSKAKYLEEATFEVIGREPEVFIGDKTGTQIIISKVRVDWLLSKYKYLYKTINSLNSPFTHKSKNEFEVDLSLSLVTKDKEREWTEKSLTVDDIKKLAMWKFQCVFSSNVVKDIKYEFLPYETMDLLAPKTKIDNDFDTSLLELEKLIKEETLNEIDLGKYEIGDVKLEMYVFYLGNKVLSYSGADSRQLNLFLKENGGVRVYRDDMRIYNYGEVEDDWLGLDQQRVSNVGGKIGNKLILGSVSIDRKGSKDLVEKTSREGFVENHAYLALKNAVLNGVAIFNNERNIDKTQIRLLYEGSEVTQPVMYDVDRLAEITQRLSEFSEDLPEEQKEKLGEYETEILKGLKSLKVQYLKTHETLVKSAGAGLNLSVVIHEIEKRIKELEKVISRIDESNVSLNDVIRVKDLVLSISKLISNYGSLVSGAKKQKNSLIELVEQAIFNSEFRFQDHETVADFDKSKSKDFQIDCSSNIVVGALLNIFDNSLYWLDKYKISERKIHVFFKDYGDQVGMFIVDNGKGFTISAEDAVQPFITTKKEEGMGLGLHIVDEMMKLQNGKLIIRDSKEVTNLPEEYKNGAVIELVFKK